MDISDLLAYFEARDARQELQAWLSKEAYGDPYDPQFALNVRTRRIALAHNSDDPLAARKPFAVFLVIPNPPWSDILDLREDTIWNWLNPSLRRYEPDPEGIFLHGNIHPALDGVVVEQQAYNRSNENNSTTRYLAVRRTGIVEMGISAWVCDIHQNEVFFRFVPLVGFLWQFLGFAVNFYNDFSQNSPFSLLVCMRSTEGALLASLAAGWAEPFNGFHNYGPRCAEPNIRLCRDGLDAKLSPEAVDNLVKDFASRIDNAWGQRRPRCYVHSNQNPSEPFDKDVFLGYSRR